MANLRIEMPDDLARRLEGIAAAQHRSVQELANRSPFAGFTSPVSPTMSEVMQHWGERTNPDRGRSAFVFLSRLVLVR
jgi:hypothetical protein